MTTSLVRSPEEHTQGFKNPVIASFFYPKPLTVPPEGFRHALR